MTKVDIAKLRENEFPIINKCLYLDHAAMSPLPKRVESSISEFHYNRMINGAGFNHWWEQVELARENVANLIGSCKEEIGFVLNTSMGINIVAQGLDLKPGDNIILTDIEFPSNVYPWLNLEKNGIEIRFVKNNKGTIPISEVNNLVDKKTKVISISFIEAGNGFKNDLKKISQVCKENNIYFVVDAIQGLGVFPIDVEEMDIDFLVSGFFKWLFGPDGIAFIYCSKRVLDKVIPSFVGWASMNNKFNYTDYEFDLSVSASKFELGNMNFSAIIGVNESLNFINEIGSDFIMKQTKESSDYLRGNLKKINKLTNRSDFSTDNQSQILLIDFQNFEIAYKKLRERGIVVNKRNGLRVSPHFYNTKSDIDRFLNELELII